MSIATSESGSFRDRNGRIYYADGQVYRGISPEALENWRVLASTRFFRDAVEKRMIIGSEEANRADHDNLPLSSDWAAILRHDKIPFTSYPYEWPFGMLRDGALLQLDLLASALEENMTLKDASSFNTQWYGAMPVFIDVPSFERYADGTPWIGYRQFCEMFMYPLMLQSYRHVPFHAYLRGKLDGITPEECNNMLSFRDHFRPGVFMHVYLQSKLQSGYGDSKREIKKEIKSSGFGKELIQSNIRKLRRTISRMEWKQGASQWSEYVQNTSYEQSDSAKKIEFVRSVVKERTRQLVWDLGCNTGTFSRIAAENSSYVVSMDSDHLAVEHFYRSLHSEGNRKILPLVMNLADTSPNLGWRGEERKSLIKRGKPDLILALALIHHMVITANIPMAEFIDWLASLCGELVIEFVSKQDPMVQKLLRNKDDQYDDYGEEVMVRSLRKYFRTIRSEPLTSGTRTLFHASDRVHS